MRRLITAAIFLVLAGTPGEAAPCNGPTGLYVGQILRPDGKLDAKLNLLCDYGTYKAQFFTSDNDFDSDNLEPHKGRVTIKIDDGVALSVLNLAEDARTKDLSGALVVEGHTIKIALKRLGPAVSATALKPRFDLTPAEWREDLRALADQLPKMHANAFYSLPKAKFESEIQALDRKIAGANADEIFIGMKIITKSIGDGHTGIGDPPDRRVMPIQFARFGDDFRVVAVGPGLDAALGKRLVKIGAVPIGAVWQRVMAITAWQELPELRNGDGLVYLSRGYALHGLDVVPDRNHVLYTLADDQGRQSAVDVKGLAEGISVPMKSVYAAKLLRSKNPNEPFWCEPIPNAYSVYCGWHSYQDLQAKGAKLFEMTRALHPLKLVIDMRDNGGGDNTVGYASVVRPIKRDQSLNAPGHLYVLVGPLTFSAAMNNAAQFQDETNATLVGETIGERPNSYQELRQFHLPNSNLVIRVSTRWYAFRPNGPNKVSPDKKIVPTWGDVVAGRDPVLDWVMKQPMR